MPILSAIIGAVFSLILLSIKLTFNLTVGNTTKKEVLMVSNKYLKFRALISQLFLSIGSNVVVGWFLPARFY